MAQAGTVWVDVRGDVSGLLGDVQGAASKAASAFNPFGAAKTVIGDIGRTTAQVTAGLTALGAAGATSLLKVGAGYNTLEQSSLAAFETLLGTRDAAVEMQAAVREFATTSPFPRQAFIEGTQQLLAFGLQAEQIIPTLNAIQNAVAAAGGGATEIDRVTSIIAKMRAGAVVSVQDLNQLGDAGVNAGKILAEQFGQTEAEFRNSFLGNPARGDEALEVIDKLVVGLNESFAGAADGLKETFDGARDRIAGARRDIGSDLVQPFIAREGGGYAVVWANEVADSMRNLQRTVIPALLPPVVALADRLSDAAASATNFASSITPAAAVGGVRRVLGVVSEAREAFRGLEGVAAGAGIAIAGIGARSVLGPLGFLVPAISPITGVLGGLVLNSQEGRDALAGLGSQARDFASGAGQELIRSFAGFAGEIEGPVARAIETVGSALFDVGNVAAPIFGQALEQLGRPIGDLIEAGSELVANILTSFADIAATVLPPAIDLLSSGIGLAADALGFLADNSELAVAALAGFAAVRAWDVLSRGADLASRAAQAIGSTVADFSTYFKVLRDDGGSIGGSLMGAGREAFSFGSALSGVNLAMAGVTAAAVIGGFALQRYSENKARVTDATKRLVDAMEAERDEFRKLRSENLRDIFDDKDALGTLNAVAISFEDLSTLASEYGEDLRKLDDAWSRSGGRIAAFREMIQQLPEPVREFADTLVALAESGDLEFRQVLSFFEAVDELAQATTGSLEDFRARAESIAREAFSEGIIDGGQLAQVLEDISRAETPDELNAAFGRLSGLLGETKNEAQQTKDEIRDLIDALADLAGADRDVDEAQRRLNESVSRLNESFAENGAGIDNSTEAGRRNADAIQRMVEQAERLASSQARVDTTGATSRQTLQGIADALGFAAAAGRITADEYEELLRLYGLTPERIETTVTAETNRAKAEIEELDRRIGDLKGVDEDAISDIRTKLDQGRYNEVREELNRLERTIEPVVRPRYDAFGDTQDRFLIFPGTAGQFPTRRRRASGGPVWPGTWLVGEAGPELIHLGQQGTVDNADRTRRVLSQDKSLNADARLIAELQHLNAAMRNAGQVNVTYNEVQQAPTADDLVWKLNVVRLGGM